MGATPKPVSALLIIDAQRGLLEGETAVPAAPQLIATIHQLLTTARSAGALIVYLQQDGAPGAVDEPGTPGWYLHPALLPEPGEVVVRKSNDDGFEGTPLGEILATHGIHRVAVAGLLSEMCVSATIRTGLVRGLGMVLVHDAHGTYDLGDIAAATVSRVAEHALGDCLELQDAAVVTFESVDRHRNPTM